MFFTQGNLKREFVSSGLWTIYINAFSMISADPESKARPEIACFTDAENITTLFVNSKDRRPNTRVRTSDPCFPKTE